MIHKPKFSTKSAIEKLEYVCANGEKCIADIKLKLYTWNIPKEDYAQVIDYLVEHQFIDELRFAKAYVRGKFNIKSRGVQRIRGELKMKHIPEDYISEALEQIESGIYQETLERLLDKKWHSIKEDDFYKKTKKALSFMIQRGYEMDKVLKTIKVNYTK
jgi:regulatory protein